MTPGTKGQITKAQNELDDCMEAITVLDNAIACGFLFDRHNLAIQNEWLKDYRERIEYLREYIDNARTNG
tara:strand:+ start:135 stop:344 length:210 start_codon:yes stop_codon:yes gene_type:complete